MPFKLVTCPETAHLELIAYDEHPLGLLVEACSRFDTPCTLACPRTCAARLDRRSSLAARSSAIDPLPFDALDVGDDTNLGIDLRAVEARLERRLQTT